MNSFKIISAKTVFSSKTFHIENREIERDGKKFSKDFVIWKPIVYILPVTKDKEIILEYQYRDGYQKTLLEIVAGHLEPGEDELMGAKRELQEETGYSADVWYKMGVIHPSANIVSDLHIYVCWGLHIGKNNLDEEEDIKVVKIPIVTAIEKAMSNEIEVGSHQAVLFKLTKLLETKQIVI